MKPTQQEIIELARKNAALDKHNGGFLNQTEIIRLVHLTLERFGAGGGEPVYLVWLKAHCTWMHTDKEGFDKTEPEYRWMFYTHLSPTDLQAEYLRGLEDAKAACDGVYHQHIGPQYGEVRYGIAACAQAIEALKGKQ